MWGFGVLVYAAIEGPTEFIFDNEKGVLFVNDPKNIPSAPLTPLPYDQISVFSVTQHLVSKEGTNRIFYAVSMLKKDGASWRFYKSSNESKAQAFCDKLNDLVQLSQPTLSDEPVHYPEGGIQVERHEDKTLIRWKKPSTWPQALPFLLCTTGFFIALLGVRPYMPQGPFYLLSVVMLLLLITALIWASIGIGKRVIVELTEDTFTSTLEAAFWGSSTFSINNEEIDAILFNFHPDEPNALYILRPKESELMNKINQGTPTLQDLLAAVRLSLRVYRLPVARLAVSEKLHLEQLLQQLLYERSCKQAR